MALLSYSFCMSMLHSLWQAGLLLMLYILADKVFQTKISPLQKRNFLFVLLTAQLSLFIVTFFIYFLNIENTVSENFIGQAVSGILSSGTITIITPYLFTIYLFIIGYKMMRALYEWHQFKKQYYTGLLKPSIDLKLFTASKTNHFGIKRKVQLWLSSNINVPVTFGFLKPVIILPVALVNRLSLQQAETLILHELTHIKANDYLLNWVLIIVENIFFFNPFITTLCNKIRLEREKYCDSSVMAFEYAPLLYAETLLQAQQVQQFIPQYQLAAVTGKKQLLQRIQYFTNSKNFSYHKQRNIFLPLVSFLFAALFISTILFQYKINTTVQPNATVAAPAYKTAVSEIQMPVFVTNLVESMTDENLKKIEAAVKKQQPVIEKQLKELEPLLQSVQEKAEEFADKIDDNFITPVALKENITTRQIVVKEEQSGSKNATLKVYTVSFINGEWVIIPEWMLAAKEVNADSINKKLIDSSLLSNKQEE